MEKQRKPFPKNTVGVVARLVPKEGGKILNIATFSEDNFVEKLPLFLDELKQICWKRRAYLEDICSFRSWEECQNDAGDDPIGSKKDFVIAVCKAVKGPNCLSDSQVSLLERCVKRLYEPYFNSRDEQTGKYDQSKIPTMRDIYNLVRAQCGFDAYDLAMTLKEVLPDLTSKEDENKQK